MAGSLAHPVLITENMGNMENKVDGRHLHGDIEGYQYIRKGYMIPHGAPWCPEAHPQPLVRTISSRLHAGNLYG